MPGEELVLTNEQLIEQAHSTLEPSALFGIGAVVDERVEAIRAEIGRYQRGETEGEFPDELRLTLSGLSQAQSYIDDAFGSITGFYRSGCSGGGPIPYRRTTTILDSPTANFIPNVFL